MHGQQNIKKKFRYVFNNSRISYVCDHVTSRFQHSNATEVQGMGSPRQRGGGLESFNDKQ